MLPTEDLFACVYVLIDDLGNCADHRDLLLRLPCASLGAVRPAAARLGEPLAWPSSLPPPDR